MMTIAEENLADTCFFLLADTCPTFYQNGPILLFKMASFVEAKPPNVFFVKGEPIQLDDVSASGVKQLIDFQAWRDNV